MPADFYLDLLKRAVTGMIQEDVRIPSPMHPGTEYDPDMRRAGGDWPSRAHTMIGMPRLDNIQECAEQIFAEGVPGDFAETGVWRGGACIFMRAILKAYGSADRIVWVADSFQGFPADTPRDADRQLAAAVMPEIAVPLEEVQHNFSLYGLLDDQVRFLKGFFSDTLPTAPIECLALLRLDGDLYVSTMDTLTHLYPKLSPGGFVIIDDYNLSPCREAVNVYRAAWGITEPVRDVDGAAVFWRKGV